MMSSLFPQQRDQELVVIEDGNQQRTSIGPYFGPESVRHQFWSKKWTDHGGPAVDFPLQSRPTLPEADHHFWRLTNTNCLQFEQIEPSKMMFYSASAIVAAIAASAAASYFYHSPSTLATSPALFSALESSPSETTHSDLSWKDVIAPQGQCQDTAINTEPTTYEIYYSSNSPSKEFDLALSESPYTSLQHHHQPGQNHGNNNYCEDNYEDEISGEFEIDRTNMDCFPFEHYDRPKQNRHYYYFEDFSDLTLTANHVEVIDDNLADQKLLFVLSSWWRPFSFLNVIRYCRIFHNAMTHPSMSFHDAAKEETVFWNEDDEFNLSIVYAGLFIVVALGFVAIIYLAIGSTCVLLKWHESSLVKQDGFLDVFRACLIWLFSAGCVTGFLVCERFYHYQFASRFWLSVIVGAISGLVVWIIVLIRQRFQELYDMSVLVKAHHNRYLIGEALVDRLQAQYENTRDIMSMNRLSLSLKQARVLRDGTFEMIVTAKCERAQRLQFDRVFRIFDITRYHRVDASSIPIDWGANCETYHYRTSSRVPKFNMWETNFSKAPSPMYNQGHCINGNIPCIFGHQAQSSMYERSYRH